MFLNYIIVSLISIIVTIIIIYFFFIRRFLKDFTQDRVMYCTEKQLGFDETLKEKEEIEEEKENCNGSLIKKEE